MKLSQNREISIMEQGTAPRGAGRALTSRHRRWLEHHAPPTQTPKEANLNGRHLDHIK